MPPINDVTPPKVGIATGAIPFPQNIIESKYNDPNPLVPELRSLPGWREIAYSG